MEQDERACTGTSSRPAPPSHLPGSSSDLVKAVEETADIRVASLAGADNILEGITRTSILKIAADLGLPTSIGPITKQDFFTADEAFFSGTAVEIAPITHVLDDSDQGSSPKQYTIGSGDTGKITSKLMETYKKIVTGENKTYQEWLTYVR